MLSFPIHNVSDISIERIIFNKDKQCISVKVTSLDGNIELELYGTYPYPIISADANIPIVPKPEED